MIIAHQMHKQQKPFSLIAGLAAIVVFATTVSITSI
jgi:hypothetical protein